MLKTLVLLDIFVETMKQESCKAFYKLAYLQKLLIIIYIINNMFLSVLLQC